MTPDYDNMNAGSELDALVAEKVLDSFVVHLGDVPHIQTASPLNDMHFAPVPHYSTDIAAAWEVVEKMRQMHLAQQFLTAFECSTPWRWALLSTEAFCLNVCRAALKAVASQQPEPLCSQCGRELDNHDIQCPELAYG